MKMAEARIKLPDDLKNLLEIESCEDFKINRFYVTADQEKILSDIVSGNEMAEEMKKLGMAYMNSTLLWGVPGTGKTTMARWIAYMLDMDFAYINFANLVDGVFGNTSRNISKIFKFMSEQECVFMIDELDCIAVDRGTESAATGGELSRITITLMQNLDYYRTHNIKTIILAATNKLDLVDPALRSRFSIEHEVKKLNLEEKIGYIKQYLEDAGIPYNEKNIKDYCAKHMTINQRNIESDMIRCAVNWISNGKKEYILERTQK